MMNSNNNLGVQSSVMRWTQLKHLDAFRLNMCSQTRTWTSVLQGQKPPGPASEILNELRPTARRVRIAVWFR